MKKIEKNGLIYFVFESFEATGFVNHCFSTRIGGVSEGDLSSLNLRFKHDKRENVVENYRRLCSAIGSDYRNTVFSHQTHKDEIYDVQLSDRGKGLIYEREIQDKDGLITNIPEIVLVTFHADCTPLYFLDPVKKVIALTHSGWRGTALSIGAKTVYKMVNDYGCERKNIICGIGPCIGGCCYQVDDAVKNVFESKFDFWNEFFKPDREKGKYLFDLEGINKRILTETGISPENIETAGLCIKCHSDLFYSHRVMGDMRGSMAAFMELRR
ncbi:MAG: peptidoglycan editing factor PgeF [Clostridiales bacterium]|nr:peptidoglycan editing factor PgeF [Clostridiales bacterium]